MYLRPLAMILICLSGLFSSIYGQEEAAGEAQTEPVTEAEAAVQEEAVPPEPKPAEKPKLPPGIMFLDPQQQIKVDLNTKILSIPAESHQTNGIIELVLGSTVSPHVRSHESSFLTGVKPSLIHAGLQLIGLKPGKPVDFNGQEKLPSGDGVYIYVSWTVKEGDTETAKRVRLETLIYNRLTSEPLDTMQWIFTGSQMIKTRDNKEIYESDSEGTVIATWHCTSAVIDIPLPEGNDDTVFYAYNKAMPPKGTAVTFLFSSRDLDAPAPAEKKQGGE